MVAMTQPVEQIVKVCKMPRELERERRHDAPPNMANEQTNKRTRARNERSTPEAKPPVLERIPQQTYSA